MFQPSRDPKSNVKHKDEDSTLDEDTTTVPIDEIKTKCESPLFQLYSLPQLNYSSQPWYHWVEKMYDIEVMIRD